MSSFRDQFESTKPLDSVAVTGLALQTWHLRVTKEIVNTFTKSHQALTDQDPEYVERIGRAMDEYTRIANPATYKDQPIDKNENAGSKKRKLCCRERYLKAPHRQQRFSQLYRCC